MILQIGQPHSQQPHRLHQFGSVQYPILTPEEVVVPEPLVEVDSEPLPVPCTWCGALPHEGNPCRCYLMPDEVSDLVDYKNNREARPEKPTPNPWRLLEPDRWLVKIPPIVAKQLGEEGFYAEEIVELLRMLLEGRLREVSP